MNPAGGPPGRVTSSHIWTTTEARLNLIRAVLSQWGYGADSDENSMLHFMLVNLTHSWLFSEETCNKRQGTIPGTEELLKVPWHECEPIERNPVLQNLRQYQLLSSAEIWRAPARIAGNCGGEREGAPPLLLHVCPDSQGAQVKRTEWEPLTNVHYNMQRTFETRFKLVYFGFESFVFFFIFCFLHDSI